MKKELVTIEFRYVGVPKGNWDCHWKDKIITIGVYDTFDEAIIEGNKALEKLEKRFKLNPNYNIKERFSKNGGCFGCKNRLISNVAYLITPFEFYAKIEELYYDEVDKTIDNVIESINEYNIYKQFNEVED